LLALLWLSASLLAQAGAEPIRSDYRNVRGVNYVPIYTALHASPNYYDVASPTAQWHFYHQHQQNSIDLDAQLTWIRRTGFNTIRFFLSSLAWGYYQQNPIGGQNQFLVNFADFIQRCHQHGLHVIPVLWNDVSTGDTATVRVDPDYQDLVGLQPPPPNGLSNINHWHRDPGSSAITVIQALQASTTPPLPFASTTAGLYVAQCLAAIPAQHASTILMWDVMNEPMALASRVQWVTDTMDLIKSLPLTNGVTRVTTWSYRVTDRVPESQQLARLPSCDVLSLHPYGHTRSTIEAMVYDATFDDLGVRYSKALLCNEIGYPGLGMSYRDAVAYCRFDPRQHLPVPPSGLLRGVPRPDLCTTTSCTEEGMGFCVWAFLIGHESAAQESNMPFKHGTGLFFHDGQVREVDAVDAFVELALLQGVPAADLWQTPGNPAGTWPLVVKGPLDPTYVAPGVKDNVSPALDDYATLATLLTAPPWFWESQWWDPSLAWTWEQYAAVALLFRKVAHAGLLDIATLSSHHNGNPITLPPRSSEHAPLMVLQPPGLTPAGLALAIMSEQSTPGTTLYFNLLSGLEPNYSVPPVVGLSGWLIPHPWVLPDDWPSWWQSFCIAILVKDFLQPFAAALRQYVVPRGGPY
jgi:hypothetical protein